MNEWAIYAPIFLKGLGAVLIIGSSVLFGIQKKIILLERIGQLECFYRILLYMKEQTSLGAVSMMELVEGCREQSAVFAPWFQRMEENMAAYEMGSFGTIWSDSIRTCGNVGSLSYEDVVQMMQLGRYMAGGEGYYCQSGMQQELWQLALGQMRQYISQEEQQVRRNIKVLQCLTVFAGLLLTVVML